jgi:acetyl-CoA carboxylase biotin carboxyl carrier protein
MQEYGLTELELDDNKRGRIKLVRALASPTASVSLSPAPAPEQKTRSHRTEEGTRSDNAASALAVSENQRLVTSPMVGTFYRASSPDAPPYAEEGTPVRKGQTLCIIEAMKMMNEIDAEVAGRVVKILCENAQAVEYGQPLMVVEVESQTR